MTSDEPNNYTFMCSDKYRSLSKCMPWAVCARHVSSNSWVQPVVNQFLVNRVFVVLRRDHYLSLRPSNCCEVRCNCSTNLHQECLTKYKTNSLGDWYSLQPQQQEQHYFPPRPLSP